MAQLVALLVKILVKMAVLNNAEVVVWICAQIHVMAVIGVNVGGIANQDVVLAVKQIVVILVQKDAQEPVLMVVKMI